MDKQPYDPNIHHRRSIRLSSYDYSSAGAYYVTTCVYERKPLLEKEELRTILENMWQALPQRFPGISLDVFAIMPDHAHFILCLEPEGENPPTLAQIVGAYKSLTARAALAYLRSEGYACPKHFWQRDYYEHVIRSEWELEQKRIYILNNPIKEQLKREGES